MNGSNSTKEWEHYRIPPEEKDDVVLWIVFRRSGLSSIFPTSAIVMADMRRRRLSINLKDRVACSVCTGSAVNRMLCVHEANVLKFMKKWENSMQCENSAEDADARDSAFWSTVFDKDIKGDDENGEFTETKTNYVSRKSRNFFPCQSEHAALILMLESVQRAHEIARTAVKRTTYFIGEDEDAYCENCKADVKFPEKENSCNRLIYVHSLHHGTFEIGACYAPKYHLLFFLFFSISFLLVSFLFL